MKRTSLILKTLMVGGFFSGFAHLGWAEDPAPRPPTAAKTEAESAWPADKISKERVEWMVKALDATIGQRLAEMKREATTRQPMQVLTRTVRLEFRSEPAGPEERPLIVRTVTDRFSVALTSKGRGQDFNMRIGGQIQLLDSNQILLVYDSNLDLTSPDLKMNVGVAGGIKLLPGRPETLATLGDHHWVVVGTFDDEPAPLVQK